LGGTCEGYSSQQEGDTLQDSSVDRNIEPAPGKARRPRSEYRIDETDRRILVLLAKDARLSARAIGREIGMSPGAVAERLRQLQDEQIVRGYHADIDPVQLGYELEAVIGLQIEQGVVMDETVKRLQAIPEVYSLEIVTGRWDLVVQVYAADRTHLLDLILRHVQAIPGFRHSETMVALRSFRRQYEWVDALPLTQRDSPESS